jgi:hemerythrin superfamily protein
MTTRLEGIGAKAMGAARAAVATVGGMTGIFRRLTQEHGEMSALLMRVQLTSSPAVRRNVFPTIRKELLAHERAEESEIFPMFQQNEGTRAIVEAHAREAGQLEMVIGELTEIAVDDPRWEQTFDRLFKLVQAHVKTEESAYFPAGQHAFAERTDEMLARFEVIRAQIMQDLNATP